MSSSGLAARLIRSSTMISSVRRLRRSRRGAATSITSLSERDDRDCERRRVMISSSTTRVPKRPAQPHHAVHEKQRQQEAAHRAQDDAHHRARVGPRVQPRIGGRDGEDAGLLPLGHREDVG